MKKNSIFVAFKPKNKLIKRFAVVAIFIATYSACIATNIGYQTPVGYYGNVVICSLARMEGDSLSYFQYFNFSFTMPKNNENVSNVKHSSVQARPNGTTSVSAPVSLQEITDFYSPDPVELTLSEFRNLILIPAVKIGTEMFVRWMSKQKGGLSWES